MPVELLLRKKLNDVSIGIYVVKMIVFFFFKTNLNKTRSVLKTVGNIAKEGVKARVIDVKITCVGVRFTNVIARRLRDK